MSYNKEEFPRYAKTAGKISVVAAIVGVCVFMFALMVDVGQQEFQKVSAQTATTSLTVLNTPPSFTLGAYEVVGSSTSTPTNSGEVIQWSAVGSDSNGAPYFLLICSTNATPTANAAPDNLNLGTAPPDCGAGAVQWGVSTATVSDTTAFVSTTTVEVTDNAGTQFVEQNDWYAWVCDDDPVQPACNITPVQGLSATNSSPFNMNQRPVLSVFGNDGGVDPGANLLFTSVSSDPDTVAAEDTLTLIVCQTNTGYSSTTNTCSNQLATSTFNPTANATATYAVAPIVRDGTYPAYGYLVDEHGHEATAIINQDFDVNNVAPTVVGGDIDLNGGADIALTVPGGETTGFTLDFVVSDANSCINSSGATSSEIVDFSVALYRSSYGTTTCDATAGSYDPNYCYPSGVASTTWNLTCTASTTSCTGPTDDTQLFECTFPMWFLADPTDAAPETPAAFAADTWVAAVAGIDDNASSSQLVNTTNPVELLQFSALNLLTAEIPYGALAPGDDSGTLGTSTVVENIGNTGLDQEVEGESMCGTFAIGNECAPSASSTIPESEQQFASSTVAYNSIFAKTLSSTTPTEADIDVAKTTSTSTPTTGNTYWGIAVPAAITVAGSYQGLNTFYAVTASSTAW